MKYLAILLSLTLLASCNQKQEISGSIFIVTKAADNKPLGAVDVALYDRATFDTASSSVMASLSPSESEYAEYKEARQNYISASDSYFKLAERYTNDMKVINAFVSTEPKQSGNSIDDIFSNYIKNAKEGENVKRLIDGLEKLTPELKQAYDAFSKANAKLTAAAKKILRPEDEIQKQLVASLGQPLTTSKTDANGKFILTGNKKARYTILAQSSRMLLPGETEVYFWAVYPDAQPGSQSIILSNQNMASVPTKEGFSYANILKQNPEIISELPKSVLK